MPQTSSVRVDGKALQTWSFFVQRLEADHWVSVGRGTPKDVVDKNGAFAATFTQPLSATALAAELRRHEPPFVSKRVRDLVPDDRRQAYDAILLADAVG